MATPQHRLCGAVQLTASQKCPCEQTFLLHSIIRKILFEVGINETNDNPFIICKLAEANFSHTAYLVKPFAFERFQLALQKFSAHMKALGDAQKLNQGYIDSVMDFSPKNDTELPKGIQERTLEILVSYLTENEGAFLPGETIAEKTGLTTVTVRKYMTYLEEKGIVKSQMNYETGGRPCVLYSKV